MCSLNGMFSMVWHVTGASSEFLAFVPLHVLKLVERGNALVLVHPPLSGLEHILDGENTFYIQKAYPRSSLLSGLEHIVTKENKF